MKAISKLLQASCLSRKAEASYSLDGLEDLRSQLNEAEVKLEQLQEERKRDEEALRNLLKSHSAELSTAKFRAEECQQTSQTLLADKAKLQEELISNLKVLRERDARLGLLRRDLADSEFELDQLRIALRCTTDYSILLEADKRDWECALSRVAAHLDQLVTSTTALRHDAEEAAAAVVAASSLSPVCGACGRASAAGTGTGTGTDTPAAVLGPAGRTVGGRHEGYHSNSTTTTSTPRIRGPSTQCGISGCGGGEGRTSCSSVKRNGVSDGCPAGTGTGTGAHGKQQQPSTNINDSCSTTGITVTATATGSSSSSHPPAGPEAGDPDGGGRNHHHHHYHYQQQRHQQQHPHPHNHCHSCIRPDETPSGQWMQPDGNAAGGGCGGCGCARATEQIAGNGNDDAPTDQLPTASSPSPSPSPYAASGFGAAISPFCTATSFAAHESALGAVRRLQAASADLPTQLAVLCGEVQALLPYDGREDGDGMPAADMMERQRHQTAGLTTGFPLSTSPPSVVQALLQLTSWRTCRTGGEAPAQYDAGIGMLRDWGYRRHPHTSRIPMAAQGLMTAAAAATTAQTVGTAAVVSMANRIKGPEDARRTASTVSYVRHDMGATSLSPCGSSSRASTMLMLPSTPHPPTALSSALQGLAARAGAEVVRHAVVVQGRPMEGASPSRSPVQDPRFPSAAPLLPAAAPTSSWGSSPRMSPGSSSAVGRSGPLPSQPLLLAASQQPTAAATGPPATGPALGPGGTQSPAVEGCCPSTCVPWRPDGTDQTSTFEGAVEASKSTNSSCAPPSSASFAAAAATANGVRPVTSSSPACCLTLGSTGSILPESSAAATATACGLANPPPPPATTTTAPTFPALASSSLPDGTTPAATLTLTLSSGPHQPPAATPSASVPATDPAPSPSELVALKRSHAALQRQVAELQRQNDLLQLRLLGSSEGKPNWGPHLPPPPPSHSTAHHPPLASAPHAVLRPPLLQHPRYPAWASHPHPQTDAGTGAGAGAGAGPAPAHTGSCVMVDGSGGGGGGCVSSWQPGPAATCRAARHPPVSYEGRMRMQVSPTRTVAAAAVANPSSHTLAAPYYYGSVSPGRQQLPDPQVGPLSGLAAATAAPTASGRAFCAGGLTGPVGLAGIDYFAVGGGSSDGGSCRQGMRMAMCGDVGSMGPVRMPVAVAAARSSLGATLGAPAGLASMTSFSSSMALKAEGTRSGDAGGEVGDKEDCCFEVGQQPQQPVGGQHQVVVRGPPHEKEPPAETAAAVLALALAPPAAGQCRLEGVPVAALEVVPPPAGKHPALWELELLVACNKS